MRFEYIGICLVFAACSTSNPSEEIELEAASKEVSDSLGKTKNNMSDFWNKRYASEEYIYGKVPNRFFKESLDKISPGKILLPAEGEGRNAVYAATQGWDVFAFDISSEGKEKALALSEENGVEINYQVIGFDGYEAEAESFDVIGLIYAHLPDELRLNAYQKCVRLLKPGGALILEGFSKKQLGLDSGGPKKLEMLFSLEELADDLAGLDFQTADEVSIDLNEGAYHTGKGEVVRIIAIKAK